MKREVCYFTNLAPHYRTFLWSLLITEQKFNFHFFFGKSAGFNQIKEVNFSKEPFSSRTSQLHRIKNFRFKNVIYWQKWVISTCLARKMDVAIFLGDMYLLSNWIAAIICRLRNIKVIFWGHGLKGDESLLKRKFRVIFYKIPHYHLVYNEYAKELMVRSGLDKNRISITYNSINNYQKILNIGGNVKVDKKKVFQFFSDPDLPVLLFIGRLTKVKKLNLLVEAFKILNQSGLLYNLLIIGDGKEKERLEELCKEYIQRGQVFFFGVSHDENTNAELIGASDLCVAPGEVGLTAIHCMSYGTPVATHNNFYNQMPEFEAVVPGETGLFFEEGNVQDMAKKIKEWFDQKKSKKEIGKACHEVVTKKYNPYKQVEIFKEVIVRKGM